MKRQAMSPRNMATHLYLESEKISGQATLNDLALQTISFVCTTKGFPLAEKLEVIEALLKLTK